jgi:hypothetical protein
MRIAGLLRIECRFASDRRSIAAPHAHGRSNPDFSRLEYAPSTSSATARQVYFRAAP